MREAFIENKIPPCMNTLLICKEADLFHILVAPKLNAREGEAFSHHSHHNPRKYQITQGDDRYCIASVRLFLILLLAISHLIETSSYLNVPYITSNPCLLDQFQFV
jgi:hypothetical protein